MKPFGWSHAGDGHGLEEMEYGIIECLWHVFNKHSWYVVGAGGFVACEASESLSENCGGQFAYDHVLERGRGGWNFVYSRERAARINIGVGREGEGFIFSHDGYILCGVARDESRV